MSHKSRI